MKLYRGVEDLIGNTPTLLLSRLTEHLGLGATLYAKLESRNPTGSAKDRIALSMILEAEASGRLAAGGTLIEPTSGNTGIGLCALAAARGYRAIIVMPDTMSPERQKLMRAFGAEVVLTPGAEGMGGAIRRAQELSVAIPGSLIPAQFENPENPAAHYRTTGPELYRDTDGEIDVFVAGVGTGGTLTGVGRYLKEQKPSLRVVGVEPASSPVLSGGTAAPHGIQGIGAGFIPKTLDVSLLDEVLTVSEEDAAATAHLLAETEGLLVGISSGAALSAALCLAERSEYRNARIAVLLPDTGERYLSSLYAE